MHVWQMWPIGKIRSFVAQFEKDANRSTSLPERFKLLRPGVDRASPRRGDVAGARVPCRILHVARKARSAHPTNKVEKRHKST
mmetsp:Transcript_12364/g.24041  ORF Transcript_12364/g.24041 Transcript_12364/m.24041 type:complete len:83 (+) Transcript_12364:76-324(+)